jgi:hypothetical protein
MTWLTYPVSTSYDVPDQVSPSRAFGQTLGLKWKAVSLYLRLPNASQIILDMVKETGADGIRGGHDEIL